MRYVLIALLLTCGCGEVSDETAQYEEGLIFEFEGCYQCGGPCQGHPLVDDAAELSTKPATGGGDTQILSGEGCDPLFASEEIEIIGEDPPQEYGWDIEIRAVGDRFEVWYSSRDVYPEGYQMGNATLNFPLPKDIKMYKVKRLGDVRPNPKAMDRAGYKEVNLLEDYE